MGTLSCWQHLLFQDIYLCLNRVLQTMAEPTHTHPSVPRQSRTPELSLVPPALLKQQNLEWKCSKDGNQVPESWQLCFPNPHLMLSHSSPTALQPIRLPRASTPAQEPKAMGSKPLPDSVFWSRSPRLDCSLGNRVKGRDKAGLHRVILRPSRAGHGKYLPFIHTHHFL